VLCAQAKFGELGFDIRPFKQAAAERAALAQLNLELKKSTSLADEAVATLHVRQTEHDAEVARLNEVTHTIRHLCLDGGVCSESLLTLALSWPLPSRLDLLGVGPGRGHDRGTRG
jgi:hypothetical protein